MRLKVQHRIRPMTLPSVCNRTRAVWQQQPLVRGDPRAPQETALRLLDFSHFPFCSPPLLTHIDMFQERTEGSSLEPEESLRQEKNPKTCYLFCFWHVKGEPWSLKIVMRGHWGLLYLGASGTHKRHFQSPNLALWVSGSLVVMGTGWCPMCRVWGGWCSCATEGNTEAPSRKSRRHSL